MSGLKTHNISEIKTLSRQQFDALYEISLFLNSTEYQDSLIENVLDMVIKAIDAERALFVKFDRENNDFHIISARNIKAESITDLSLFSSGILKRVVNEKKALLFHDALGDPNLSQFESIHIQKIKSVIGVPILRDNEVWGVILADSQLNRKEFTNENLAFLNFISNLFALSLDRIIDLEKLQDENRILKTILETEKKVPDLVGNSKAILDLSKLINKVATTNATVLILGESGTGKDLVARAIHKLSDRNKESYVAQFCGSIPDNLLESELFGYKKGAFTGADKDKKGLLEVADKGTFFLDEIADISGALQAKLLRVLENKEILRLGDTEVRKVDVRIIAATNKDLSGLVKEGKFREDLYYRLNIFPIIVPPLRERKDDIALLVKHFISESKKKHTISPGVIKTMERYDWPGNVRQLINVIQRAQILCDDNKITLEHIFLEDSGENPDLNGTLKELENYFLLKRFNEFKGNKTLTAKSLDVSVRWVQLRLKELNIQE